MLLLVVLACAAGPPRPPPPAPAAAPASLDCCACQTWGSRGIAPTPDWTPPPRPGSCDALLAEPRCAEALCPDPA